MDVSSFLLTAMVVVVVVGAVAHVSRTAGSSERELFSDDYQRFVPHHAGLSGCMSAAPICFSLVDADLLLLLWPKWSRPQR
jgi:hypothetical protein